MDVTAAARIARNRSDALLSVVAWLRELTTARSSRVDQCTTCVDDTAERGAEFMRRRRPIQTPPPTTPAAATGRRMPNSASGAPAEVRWQCTRRTDRD